VGLDLEKVDFPSPNHGHVVIGSGQPVLFYPIDKTAARMLCDVKAPMPSISNGDMKRYLQQSVRPILPEGVVSSFDDALENGRIRYMPNQWLTATPNRTPGVLLLGDALNMRHPLTGGGMTVALSDAVTLSDLLAPENVPDLGDADHVQKVARVFFDKRKRPSAVVNVLAMALYALFAADSEDLRILQRGCFGYFMLGGECVGGPVSLLSGLESNFTVLFYHFFSVAFYSIWLNILARGILGFPIALIQAFTVLYTACVVFLPIMFQEFK
jgi:squalene monooxygenase